MANKYNDLDELFSAIATSIKNKKGTTNTIIADNFPTEINNLEISTYFDYINKDITIIGDYAYYGMNSLKSAIFPNVEDIGEYAFDNCENLEFIAILKSDCVIGENAIPANDGLIIYGISGSTAETYATENGITFYPAYDISATANDSVYALHNLSTGLLSIRGNGNMISWSTSNSTPWSSFKTSIVRCVISYGVLNIGYNAFFNHTGLTSVEIPDSVTIIEGNAFSGCSNLISLKLSNNVTSIENSAFYNCTSLISLIIPDSVTYVGQGAFNKCTGLTSLIISNNLTTVGQWAFAYCSNLTSVIIPDSLTTLSMMVFSYCKKLTTVTIPKTVISIGSSAFATCPKITSVRYQGTIAEWNAITLADNWIDSSANYTIYCTDGNIAKS